MLSGGCDAGNLSCHGAHEQGQGRQGQFSCLHVMVNGCYYYHFNDNSHQGGLIIFHWHAMAVNIIMITPTEA